MSTTIYYDHDADPHLLAKAKVAILGYGSQGRAHALNLHDRGLDVRVGLREGSPSRVRAAADGLAVQGVAAAAREADVVAMLVPDPLAGEVYVRDVAPHLDRGDLVLFAHGFAVHFGEVVPPPDVDVVMVAPKCPGHRLRELFREGVGPPALVAVAQDASGKALGRALAYAQALGCTRAGVLETTFAEETETDLFGEQAVLCGGVSALVQAGFEILVEAGYQPEIAYFECLHELKLIVDLIYRGGLSEMRHSISDTAEFGDYTAGPQVVTDETRRAMLRLLERIRSGEFAREWLAESRSGGHRFRSWREQQRAHAIEEVGARLRAMMPWSNAPEHAPSVCGASAGERQIERLRAASESDSPPITTRGAS